MDLRTISDRLTKLIDMKPKLNISADLIASKTAAMLVNNIKTSEIDMISAGICANHIIDDYEYDSLAARIVISNLHSMVPADLNIYADDLTSYKYRDTEIKILHPKTIAFIKENLKDLHAIIDYDLDYQYNYFGAVTLINSYLLSYKYDNDKRVTKERPQQMLMRVAIGIHFDEINDDGTCDDEAFQSITTTYELLSKKYYTHATPTLFNAGTINHTLSSCYLLSIDDNLENIYGRLSDIAKISKFSGGVGIHVSQVRAQGSVIGSTIGRSQGLVPMLRVFNESTKYVSQGGGKRKGSTAVYVEPWHSDIEACLASQKQQGVAENLCRDLFLALWIPDLFMERLKDSLKPENANTPVMWSLMCPNESKGLADVYGEEFKHLYEKYESEGRYTKRIPVLNLWNLIVSTQIETGKPYIMYKDHVNTKCNQNNLGTIKSSNLCVHGDTKILTKDGYVRIADVVDQTVTIWDTEQFVDARVSKTGTDQRLINVTTTDGFELKCTNYHRFAIIEDSKVVIKEAQELKTNDLLVHSNFPILSGIIDHDVPSPYDTGFSGSTQVPINATLSNRIKWLSGFADKNGSIIDNKLVLKSTSKSLMVDVKLMCTTFGINPTIVYDSSVFRLQFSMSDTFRLFIELGIECVVLQFINVEVDFSECNITRVKSVDGVTGLHDTYCFKSPINEMGIFNGIPTMNCSEITIYSDEKQVGVCNLASICLPKFVRSIDGTPSFDYNDLNKVVQRVVYNMNKVMDNNKYPIQQAKFSDEQNRPIGIGVQGLSEVFMIMRQPYDSPISRAVNKQIFETMYYAALTASNKLAQAYGPYKTFKTSMTANGIFQFDLWDGVVMSKMWDWDSLREKVKISGLRNSLLMCIMPTAGTSIIMEHTESVEVSQSNVFTRSTLSGRFQVVNKYLMRDLKDLGLWTVDIRNKIIQNDGSVANIVEIPQRVRDIYKTVYEYKLSHIIEMCADREAYICQSASNNRFMVDPSVSKLTKMHLYSWKMGLKTSSYYVRCKQLVTGKKLLSNVPKPVVAPVIKEVDGCSFDEEGECLSCSA